MAQIISAQNIVINEIMASNQTSLFDEDGNASDWIELYNNSNESISLNGYGLSDDTLNVHKWIFGNTVIDPGGYILVFASGKDRKDSSLHTNFKINASGERIILSDSSGIIIDQIDVPASPANISYARQSDGLLPWIFQTASPASSNSGNGILGLADSISASYPGGFYTSPITVTLTAGDSKIFYSLDGSNPDSGSTEYSVPLNISSTVVLKAISYKANSLPGPIIYHTYFINESTDLPVISLSADPYDLFDPDSGIYTNFTEDWERPAHIEFFEDNKTRGFSENCAIDIHGAQSANWDQKSFNVKFKSTYGISKLAYPLFPGFDVTKFNSFVLRNSGNDWQYTHIRDAMMQTLIKNLDIDYLEYRPATTFINGEYWGIYNIREKISEDYVASRHNIDPDNIDMLENNMGVRSGDSLDYQQILDFMSTNDMSTDSAYEYLDSKIDMKECILYFAAEAYYDNLDWPGTNITFWRERNPAGKWRWIIHDLDFGFSLYAHGAWEDHIQFMFSPVETRYSNPPWATFFQRKLIENPIIKNKFINQIADLLNTNFTTVRVAAVIDTLANHIASELPKHRSRWGLTGETLTKMKTFAQDRPAYLRTHVRNYFKCGNDGNITVNILSGGKVKLNSLVLDSTTAEWSGIYFQNNQIHLKAIPEPGYKFDGWSGDTATLNPSLSMYVKSNTAVFASFSPDIDTTEDIVINEINYNSSDAFNPGDWVELYNKSNATVDMSNWTFTDSDTAHRFVFPSGTILEPDGYLVVVENDSAFTLLFPTVTNYIGETGFGLNGSGEFMQLINEQGKIIDSLTYDDQVPWPTEPDGFGATLELLDPLKDNSQGENWGASAGHGTPGKKNSVVTSVEREGKDLLPDEYCLFQNYPNPFNPVTTITYSLSAQHASNSQAETQRVILKVYNVLGKEIQTLVNEMKPPGMYSLHFDASLLSSGIYFYRLQAGNYIETKRMVLLK